MLFCHSERSEESHMEDPVVNNPIQQAPVNPVPVSKKPNLWMIATIVLAVVLVIGSIYMLNVRLQKQMFPPPPEPPLPPRITIQPSRTESEKRCWQYTDYYKNNGNPFTVCAICGNNVCEPYEICTPSSKGKDVSTTDCGGLYCPQDCESKQEQVVCTADAKECPDGSFVSRQGPNCEFAKCP
jgi:hypothetical protein